MKRKPNTPDDVAKSSPRPKITLRDHGSHTTGASAMSKLYYFKAGDLWMIRYNELLRTTAGTKDREYAAHWPTAHDARRATKKSRKDAAENGGINWKLVAVHTREPNDPTPRRPKITLDAEAVGALLGGIVGGFTKALLSPDKDPPATHCGRATLNCFVSVNSPGNPYAWPPTEACKCTCSKCVAAKAAVKYPDGSGK